MASYTVFYYNRIKCLRWETKKLMEQLMKSISSLMEEKYLYAVIVVPYTNKILYTDCIAVSGSRNDLVILFKKSL